jgi:hypothetical protein
VLTLAIFCFGPGHGGSWATLALPGTAARQLLVPAAITLFFTRQWLPSAAAFGGLTLTHPTSSLFLLVPLGAYAAVRLVEWRRWAPVLAAALVPTGLALLWLKPIVDETVSHDPGPVEQLRSLHQYGSQLVVSSVHHYRLAPEVFGRSGAVAVAGLLAVPVAGFALRRRWAALVLGGSLAVLLLCEVPWLFVHFSDAVSLSQSRRAAGFVPFAIALAGGLAVLAGRTVLVAPAALAAGILLQRFWPGDFAYGLRHGGPSLATWIALGGGAAALVLGVLRRAAPRERHGIAALAALLFALPVFLHGLWHWSPSITRDPDALSPRLVHRLRAVVPKGSIVIAPIQTSYRVTADAPLYVVALPVTHVADTKANDPYTRARLVREWVRTDDPAIARRYHATWAIRNGRLYPLPR